MSKIRLILGPPGTGKTSYLAQKALEAAGIYGTEAVVMASLTRAAAAEIRGRGLPLPKDRIGTLHSFAYRALGNPKLVDRKNLAGWNKRGNQWQISGVDSDPEDREIETIGGEAEGAGDRPLAEYLLWRARCRPGDPGVAVRAFGEEWEAWKAESGLLDFEDLIERATADCRRAPGAPQVIYLDEGQDHAASEFNLAIKWGEAAGALVIAGDSDQTLFSFRGADPIAFMGLAKAEHRHVLEQSYRVPRAVHATAIDWISQIPGREEVVYHPRDFEGEVIRSAHLMAKSPAGVLDTIQPYLEDGKSCMVIASCSYIIDPLKHQLKAQGIPFHNPYRIRRGDWNPLRGAERVVNFLRPSAMAFDEDARPWTWQELWSWIEAVDADHLESGCKTSIRGIAHDQAIANSAIYPTIDEAIDFVRSCFRENERAVFELTPKYLRSIVLDKYKTQFEYAVAIAERSGIGALTEKPKLIIGTAHSLKGSEADVVLVFGDLSTKFWLEWNRSDGKDSIRRLFYVAMTRARETLILAGTGGKGVRF